MIKKPPLDELSAAVGRILGVLLTHEKVDDAVHHLAQAVKESIPSAVGAGVSILDSSGQRTSTGFTDPVVQQADRFQYELGQGPCLTAWASEEQVLVDDVALDRRWPEWSAAVRELPIRSVASVPLMVEGHAIGALKAYAGEPGVFTIETTSLMHILVSPAATLLSHIQSRETVERMSEGLQTALHSRDLINQACGILLERKGLTSEQALMELMKTARQERTSLRGVSAELVAGTTARNT